MSNQTFEIADLIKPKFQPGQLVFRTYFDSKGIESIQRVFIDEIRFIVRFQRGRDGKTTRKVELVYDLLNNGTCGSEDVLFATAEEAARAAK